MSIHIGAKQDEIASTVLLPGDPLRAKYIAETFLEGVRCYNKVRGMFGFTGTYKGQPVSVQGTGMGIPSVSIYTHELLEDYKVSRLIRVGTCGAYQMNINVRDIILAMSASTDSAINHHRFGAIEYAPTASFELLVRAHREATNRGLRIHVGNVFSTDTFYTEDSEMVNRLMSYHTLAVEMETSAIYTLAAKYGAEALSVLTVSDHLVTGEQTSAADREQTFREMAEIALEISAQV